MQRRNVVKLSADEIQKELATLEGWKLVDGKLHRKLEFDDFVTAFGFMTKLALVAERLNHHPEWSNVYSRVSITLTTHDAEAITSLDIELARAAQRFYRSAN